jgi:hypothetical protein
MVLKGNVNGVSSRILIDTGASGTAFINRLFCIDESIVFTSSKVGIPVILGDESKLSTTDTATITIKSGHFKSKVQCLVIENLADYPLILGCPWLSHHVAVISFSRKQVVFRKTNGKSVAINTLDAQHSDIEEPQLSFLGDNPSLPSDCHLLSSYKVVHVSKRWQIADAFLFPLQSDTTEVVGQSGENADVFPNLIPRYTDAEVELSVFFFFFFDAPHMRR